MRITGWFLVWGICLIALCGPDVPASAAGAEQHFYVSPQGDDAGPGTLKAPFRTLPRAQTAARAAAADMHGDLIVHLAPGEYRLERTLEFTEADAGRNGARVIYRSEAGPGQARLLGSRVLRGWQADRNGIWKISTPAGSVFHTLYEQGRRAHKARFPNYEHNPDMPTARGRYLVSVDGTPKRNDKEIVKHSGPGWLEFAAGDAPPVTVGKQMQLLIFTGGKCDWHRDIFPVESIDLQARKLVFLARSLPFGIGTGARFFLEDALEFLDAPGEFYHDEASHTLYYMPLGKGSPDGLGVAMPLVRRLVQVQGASRDKCVSNLELDGLGLEETDDFPIGWWSTQFGRTDGALVWMSNTQGVTIRNCHLKNSGRSGIMMIGHNVGNLVTGCWIERMGVNGVTLCNRFVPPGNKETTADRCERNRVENNRIHDIGQIHTYAACVNVFNASRNEVSHCDLFDCVRYAVTVRGNTGVQYGPPVWTRHPPAVDNRFHHLRVMRCGQDGGDMGALHTASLNNPDGPSVNTFEQITVADSRAIPSMKDIPPDGIFLDWPKMSMQQVFRCVEIIRSQGRQLRSNGPDNADSAQTENVSWKPGFRAELMDYEHIGVTAEFPAAYGGRGARSPRLPAPAELRATPQAYDTVCVEWKAVPSPGATPVYQVLRDGTCVCTTRQTRFLDRDLHESTRYRYQVTARAGDFSHGGPLSASCEVRTPADRTPPAVTGVRSLPDAAHLRVAFSEPVDANAALAPANYRFTPPLEVKSATALGADVVELTTAKIASDTVYRLTVANLTDRAAAHNRVDAERSAKVNDFQTVAAFALSRAEAGQTRDDSGGGGHARLCGGATMEAGAGPEGQGALVLDGKTAFAEAPADLNLGRGDFTLMAWIYRENSGVIVSKGTDFGRPSEWSWGWGQTGLPRSIALRINNQYFSTAAGAIPDREWVHVAFVRRGKIGQCYVNGLPSGTPHDMSGVAPLVNDRLLRIGRRKHEPAPAYFRGKVAGLTILNTAFSAEQIRARIGQAK